jgi:Protein of unknown function (DUF3108)
MWNKIVELMQDPSYKRLGFALIASVVLHIFLLGGLDLTLPNLKKEMHLIEARIQMPKPVVKQVDALKPEETVAPKPASIEPLKPVAEPKTEEVIEPSTQEDTVAALETIPQVTPPVEPPQVVLAENGALESPQEMPQSADMGLVINENAYQFVETDFDVRTKIDGSAEGKAKITYNLIDGNHYQLKWLTEGRGFAALIFPDLLQISEGFLIATGLQPSSYLYQFGNKTEKTRTVNFDWLNKKVTMQTSKGIKTEDLTEGAQDLLSFMYQFMYVAPMQNLQIPIATGKNLRIYDYSFEGEENINSSLGEIKTMRIMHSGIDTDEKTELWLAIDYQYVPVKIRKIEKNGDVVEMVATRINSNRPIQNE